MKQSKLHGEKICFKAETSFQARHATEKMINVLKAQFGLVLVFFNPKVSDSHNNTKVNLQKRRFPKTSPSSLRDRSTNRLIN